MLTLLAYVLANDPAGSWLSYARYDAPAEVSSTLNTTWTVPSLPAQAAARMRPAGGLV